MTVNYREAYGLYACNGILFNHESPIRGETFVSRKITRAVAAIAKNKQKKLYLGNLNSLRDWGHAKDYVEAMWKMLQLDAPEDFVIATGVTTEVREFVRLAFAYIGIQVGFKGEGLDEIGYIESVDSQKFMEKVGMSPKHLNQNQEIIFVDERYFRPTEVDLLVGDSSKARSTLNWAPQYDLNALVDDMVSSDLARGSK
jgi:GDPmannose 4,6-dehydratase